MGEGCAGIGLAHEGFADEEGVVACFAEVGDVLCGADSAFRDPHDAGWECAGARSSWTCGSTAKVWRSRLFTPIIWMGIWRCEVEGAVELVGGVDLAEDVELEVGGGLAEGQQLLVRQGRDDEEDGVGPCGAGFEHLEGIDHEVLAQARNRDGGRGDLEVHEGAPEELLVGEDRERGGAGGLERARQGGGIEGVADEALGAGMPS